MQFIKCSQCGLNNAAEDTACERCGAPLRPELKAVPAPTAELSLTAEVTEVQSGAGPGGYVDVRYRLERGAAVFAVVTVRVFFDRDDLTLAALKAGAVRHGLDVCRQVGELKPVPASRAAAAHGAGRT